MFQLKKKKSQFDPYVHTQKIIMKSEKIAIDLNCEEIFHINTFCELSNIICASGSDSSWRRSRTQAQS